MQKSNSLGSYQLLGTDTAVKKTFSAGVQEMGARAGGRLLVRAGVHCSCIACVSQRSAMYLHCNTDLDHVRQSMHRLERARNSHQLTGKYCGMFKGEINERNRDFSTDISRLSICS